jgi:nucleotide-binding universal stress UspA family protein
MPLKDILLHIDCYPEPTAPEAIEQAIQFTSVIGGTLSALAVQIHLPAPSNWLAERLIHLSDIASREEAKSADAAEAALALFTAKAKAAGVMGEAVLSKANLNLVGDHVAERSRTRDLCLIPLGDAFDHSRALAEAVIFGSGRPTLLFRPGAASLPSAALSSIVLAWDGSRCAARAMADALPVLMSAREVRVLTVTNEKPEARTGIGAAAVRHLQSHGVAAVLEEVDASERQIGPILEDYVRRHSSDILVMGAYGRSRVREFILGGATEYMLHAPKIPLLLSH